MVTDPDRRKATALRRVAAGQLDLAAIRERYAKVEGLADSDLTGTALGFAAGLAGTLSAADVPDLLAEVERLLGELADMAGPVLRTRDRASFAQHAHPDAVRVYLARARARAATAARDVAWLESVLEAAEKRCAGLALPCDQCGGPCRVDDVAEGTGRGA